MDILFLENELVNLYKKDNWQTNRKFLTNRIDDNPFFISNCLFFLNDCKLKSENLIKVMLELETYLLKFQNRNRVWHWPLINNHSKMTDAFFFNKLKWFNIDPDADCSCLLALTKNKNLYQDDMLKDLEFYRFDNVNFTISNNQQKIFPNYYNTFLTWWPIKYKHLQIEQLDLSVICNILLFLNLNNLNDVKGKLESEKLLTDVINSDYINTEPYLVSPYYPKTLLIIFMIARLIHFSDKRYVNLIDPLLYCLKKTSAKSDFESLLLVCIGIFLQNNFIINQYRSILVKETIKNELFYVWPISSGLNSFNSLSKQSFMQMDFSNKALTIVLKRWALEKLNT